MTIPRDEVLRMIDASHMLDIRGVERLPGSLWVVNAEAMERFAALVAAAERKRCKDAIKGCRKSPESFDSGDVYIGYDDAIDNVLTSLDEI